MQTASNHGRKESNLLPLFVEEIGMIIEPNTKTDFFYVDGEYRVFKKCRRKQSGVYLCAERALLEYK